MLNRAGPLALALTLLLSAAPGIAQPLTRSEVPDPLRPWIDWVLRDDRDAACPFIQAERERRQCVWPSRLRLTLDDRQGSFRQSWLVHRAAWVPLPGDRKLWPQDVSVDGAAAIVVRHAGLPSIRLQKGTHRVHGSFRWPRLPELLKIPAETGLVSLRLRGQPVAFPRRDLEGRLWLQTPVEDEAGESRLDVIVHRRLIDDVPMRLESDIEIKAAGKAREVLLGRALPDGFIPMSLTSPLPARIDPDGRLRLQIRPGSWRLTLVARSEAPLAVLRTPEKIGPWDAEEVWVFESRNHLRLVSIEGAPAIDPQQTTLPEAWKALPAYLMQAGGQMRIVEKRRGDADPAPDQLRLARTWWLDFDGGGFTVHDSLSGSLSRSWRLEMGESTKLGRVAIEGRNQFISRLGESGRPGLEVRQGAVQIDADSRIEGRAALSAVGWNHDFQRVSGQLNLPPGWRLFHATGVDELRSTWLTRWSLLEIFLVLITALAVGQLFGWGWGGVALATLILIYPEDGAPRWSWLALLGALALLRAIPEGRLRRWVKLYHIAAVVSLVLIAVPFSVQQVRQAFYPALEIPWLSIQPQQAGESGAVAADEVAPAEPALKQRARRMSMEEGLASNLPASAGRVISNYYAPDPQVLVSTGPGLPHWGWRLVKLGWRGPVARDQSIRLLLVPPWLNSLLSLGRVALLVLLALILMGVGSRLGPWLSRLRGGTPAVALAAGFLLTQAGPAAAEFPSAELLEELRSELLEKPDCFPSCASSPRLSLQVRPSSLRLRMQVDVAWETAVPLPGGAEHWVPASILLNDAPAKGIAQSPDGQLWLQLPKGRHRIVMDGPLPDRESVQLPLPLRPHRVEAKLEGWVIDGLGAGGVADRNLQLTRVRREATGPTTLQPSELPPFLHVERILELGLIWQMRTRVSRLTPPGKAVLVSVPLLVGESVTTEGINVEDGAARVNMGPRSTSVSWTSLLEHSDRIVLRARESMAWSESWRLDVSPVWHVEIDGLPTVHQPQAGPVRIREWRPWPGEGITLDITRPAGVAGPVLTIDRSALTVSPGLRASDVTLELSLRASRGAQHPITLPENAVLQWVEIDGVRQPIRQIERAVTLPIQPGKHRVRLSWRADDGIAFRLRTPEVDLGVPSVNAELRLAMPKDRWTLLVGGPRMGPAILFWSLLSVALIAALGLGRIPLTPLGWPSWLLLFVGLTQVPVWLSVIVAGWLLALGWRREHAAPTDDRAFDGLQILLAAWTGVALLGLIWAIRQGLLGLPDMHVTGNGSSAELLRWYMDRAEASLPQAWALSVPLSVYRLAMLAWALWLARALIQWLRWGWSCFSEGGLWKPFRSSKPAPAEENWTGN